MIGVAATVIVGAATFAGYLWLAFQVGRHVQRRFDYPADNTEWED